MRREKAGNLLYPWLLVVLVATPRGGVVGCGGDGAASGDGPNGGHNGPGDRTAGIWVELKAGALDTGGGAAVQSGGQGAPGGAIDVSTTGALSVGGAFAMAEDVPAVPENATRITSLDADASLTGPAVLDGDLMIAGGGTRRLTVMGGDLFITGTLRAPSGGADRSLLIEVPGGTIYVQGTVDTSATGSDGQPGGALGLTAARVVVAGTLRTEGGTGGGRAGDVRVTTEGDVLLFGTVLARGGAVTAAGAQAGGGSAAALSIDAGGRVQIGGIVDLRGGPAKLASGATPISGGAGGHVTIGAMRAPSSVTFALDLSLDGGDGHGGAGVGGNFTAKVGGDFTLAGSIQSRGGSIAPGATADGGLAGTFTLDINTTVGNQVFRPGGVILLDGGSSGGVGTAGGGGHLYARSFDGTVTMSGSLLARGGAARDPGGVGGLGGHVNIFSDRNTNGVGGNLTVTPEGIIDVSGGAGTIGGSARNDGIAANVATFPDHQETIAVLLNADGIHGTPADGIIDNQGVVIARGGASGGAGGDIAFHGEGTGGLHDPLGGHLEMNGEGGGPDGSFASE